MSIRVNVNALVVHEDRILLIKFEDENGPHYNLPGGGVDPGESVRSALIRECQEEANAAVTVQGLVGAWEYVPELENYRFGPKQKVGLIFLCNLNSGSVPSMPVKPDLNQVDVVWLEISKLEEFAGTETCPIFPQIDQHLLEALRGRHSAFFASSKF